jgi:transposase InsO family protein
MIYPLVRELAEDGIPVTVTCRVLKFSPQGYYKWRKNPITKRDLDNARLTNLILDAHHDDPPFGYRFLADELERQGERVCERRVWRLCSEQRIWSSFVKKSRSGKKPGPPVHDDLVQRDFSAERINQLWFTDLTEHQTMEGKLYLCSLEDACSGRIVGYSIGDRMTADLCVSALRNAIALRRPRGTICHSDRGSQFRSTAFVRTLKNNGLVGSMGRVAAAGDNAAMESFHALLQKNVLNAKKWDTREELRVAIVTWIERTYHRRRRKRRLGKMTPVEFEALFEAAGESLVAA